MTDGFINSLLSCLSNWFLLEFGLVTDSKATFFLVIECQPVYEVQQNLSLLYDRWELWAFPRKVGQALPEAYRLWTREKESSVCCCHLLFILSLGRNHLMNLNKRSIQEVREVDSVRTDPKPIDTWLTGQRHAWRWLLRNRIFRETEKSQIWSGERQGKPVGWFVAIGMSSWCQSMCVHDYLHVHVCLLYDCIHV